MKLKIMKLMKLLIKKMKLYKYLQIYVILINLI